MKIDIQRAIEVLAACGYECPELEEIPVAGVITLAGRVLGRNLTPPECRELGYFLGEMAAKK